MSRIATKALTPSLFPISAGESFDRYLDANVEAVREVTARVEPDIALANHLVMGPVILARALRGSVPFAVVVHGSALKYTVKPHPRFLPYAHEGLDAARCVLVGSRHTAQSLWAALDDPALPARTRLGPPGVDIRVFHARARQAAAEGLRRLVGRLTAHPTVPDDRSSFSRDTAAAATAIEQLRPGEDRIVLFLGKEIVAKGLDLLLAAWPLVLQRVPNVRLVVVGFEAWHPTAVRMTAALADNDLKTVRGIAEEGRSSEGGPRGPLRYLLAFLDSLHGDTRQRFLEGARGMNEHVLFTGGLEHEEVAELLPACEALVMPSTYPSPTVWPRLRQRPVARCRSAPITLASLRLAVCSKLLYHTKGRPGCASVSAMRRCSILQRAWLVGLRPLTRFANAHDVPSPGRPRALLMGHRRPRGCCSCRRPAGQASRYPGFDRFVTSPRGGCQRHRIVMMVDL